jgi:hypothetical protein
MSRDMFDASLPWFIVLCISIGVLWCVLKCCRNESDWRRILRLHRDEGGSVQSLSLILTLPIFVWVMMFIVQVSQLMIGEIVVHYAAFAAARAAIVWIPAHVEDEPENVLAGGYALAAEVIDGQPDTPIVLDSSSPDFGPRDGWLTYMVDGAEPLQPLSRKTDKILTAALLPIASICPSSRDAGQTSTRWNDVASDVARIYSDVARNTSAHPDAIAVRMKNKLAYAAEHTRFRIYFRHPNCEPPLKTWGVGATADDWREFRANDAEFGTELGFQDQVTITIVHDYALLPGPGRLLAKFASADDPLATELQRHTAGSRYCYTLTASATLSLEGEKPAKRYDETWGW